MAIQPRKSATKPVYDVSVLITTCDRHVLCDRAVASVFAQNFIGTIEILIIDDGSLHPYTAPRCKQKNISVRLLRNESKTGQAASRNLAIIQSKGKYITGLDDDDYFTSNRINEFMINIGLISDRGYSGLFSDCINTGLANTSRVKYPKIATYDKLKWSNCVGNQIFTEAALLKSKYMFNENMLCLEDWELWIRLAKYVGPLYNVSKPTIIVDSSHGLQRVTTNTQVDSFDDASQYISRLLPKLARLNLKAHALAILVRRDPHRLNFRKLIMLLVFLKLRTLKILFVNKINHNQM
jgi:glycosyltransferase involved in cell wall biosynthesis